MCSAFSRLPLEILINFLRQAPDLPTIYNFTRASAKVSAAFELDPIRILDGVIERSIPDLRHLARMIAILGAFNIPPDSPNNGQYAGKKMTFKMPVEKFKSLDKDILTTPSLSAWGFIAGTRGPRYLLLIADRIQNLEYLCLATLLQNIHELIFPISKLGEKGANGQKEDHRSGPGITFEPAVWWSPSHVERYRVERTSWNLMIYWNVRSINPALEETYDYDLTCYTNRIEGISRDLKPQRWYCAPQVDYMNCVSNTIQEAIGNSSLESIFTFSDQSYNSRVEKPWLLPAIVLKDIAQRKLENLVPVPLQDLANWRPGQERQCLLMYNSIYRELYWASWYSTLDWRVPRGAGLNLKDRDMDFPDYLGLCFWDRKRLAYLGLESQCETEIDFQLGLPKKPSAKVFSSNSINERWVELLLHELVRLPGGQKYIISDDCKILIEKWKHAIEEYEIRWNIPRHVAPRTE